jgi:signal transduction histidine kinase
MNEIMRGTRPVFMLRLGLSLMLLIAVGAAVSDVDVWRLNRESLVIGDYMHALDDVQLAMLQMESGQRGYMISGDDKFLAPYTEGRLAMTAALARLDRFDPAAIGLKPPEVPIASLVVDKANELDRTLTIRRTDGPAAGIETLKIGLGRLIMGALRDELDDLRRQGLSIVNRLQRHVGVETYLTILLIASGLLISGFLVATSVALLRQEIYLRQSGETRLREHQAELARSNGELEQFAYVASHDLQEPLRMISSYTQLLRRRYAGKLDATADEFIGYAVDGTKRMQALINDLLHYSRVTSTAKPMGTTDLEVAFKDTMKDLEIRIEDCAATITHDALPTLQADEVQIRQLLINLIANGMKFQEAGHKPEIHVSVTRDGNDWRFGVKDNGIGIDPRYFDNLFQIFRRLHSRDEYPGTGIGLAVCKKIIERHGGRIWVESALGEGATFLFTLPAEETPS